MVIFFIRIPNIIVISTSEFDDFMEINNLWKDAIKLTDNKKIEQKFIKSKLTSNGSKKINSLL